MSFMLHRLYPWKLFKDIENMIFGRLTGPEYPSSSLSRLFASDAPQHAAADGTIHQPLSASSHTLLPGAMGATTMSVLEGAKDVTLNHPLFNNIGGNAIIVKVGGGQFSCWRLKWFYLTHASPRCTAH